MFYSFKGKEMVFYLSFLAGLGGGGKLFMLHLEGSIGIWTLLLVQAAWMKYDM